jgi:hypothetical protein
MGRGQHQIQARKLLYGPRSNSGNHQGKDRGVKQPSRFELAVAALGTVDAEKCWDRLGSQRRALDPKLPSGLKHHRVLWASWPVVDPYGNEWRHCLSVARRVRSRASVARQPLAAELPEHVIFSLLLSTKGQEVLKCSQKLDHGDDIEAAIDHLSAAWVPEAIKDPAEAAAHARATKKDMTDSVAVRLGYLRPRSCADPEAA